MKSYKKTIIACFIGYVVQAIINNFVPLLFLAFQREYNISLKQITLLVTFNFGVQLLVDYLAAKYADRIGYRKSIVFAHICSALGLIGLAVFPELLENSYIGILISVVIYAIGGGLIEVLVSPIVEACPTNRKDAVMSLLHSFYCFGHVFVVLISTAYLFVFGIDNWKVLAFIWAVVPILNGLLFLKVPICSLIEEGEKSLTLKELFKNKFFIIMVILMFCAGSSEQAVSQWSSAFAEKTLGITKALGDILGPLSFALFMGISRAIYGKLSKKIELEKYMKLSALGCIISYLIVSAVNIPFIAVLGCSFCGFAVGILWPGTFSIASRTIPLGGTPLFAFLALAGDVGCMTGPTFVGMISSAFEDNLKIGIAVALIFPILLILGLFKLNKIKNTKEK